ncbi:MAG: hypothetical protein Kow0037_00770 [Calditrichia bacterium]
MNPEILQLKGQLADLKKKYGNMDIEASGLIIQLRTLLNPYTEDVTELNAEQIRFSAKRLADIIRQMQALKPKINQLQEALGG